MKEELKQKRQEEGKARAIKYLKECMDENGTLNITKFRNMHRAEYSKLATYFGSVDNAIAEIGAIKITNQKTTPTLAQRLAYDYIKQETETRSVADMARQYGVSKPALNQLYHTLRKFIEPHTIKQDVRS